MNYNTVIFKNIEAKYQKMIFYICSIIIILYNVPEDLDLYRYYKSAENFSGSLFSFIETSFETNYDFVYVTSLRLLHILGVPMSIATCIYVSFFFIGSLHLVNYYLLKENTIAANGFLVVSICMLVPFSWIICVSRSTAAFCFLFYALWSFLRKKKVLGSIYTILSILSHVSMILFWGLFVISMLVKPIVTRLRTIHVVLILLGFILLSGFISILFSDLFNLLSMSTIADNRYGATYLDYDVQSTTNFFLADNLSKGERAHVFVLMIIYSTLLLIVKNKDLVYTVLFISTLLFSFFLFNIETMVLRMVMFMVPVTAVTIIRCYYIYPAKNKYLKYLLYMSALCELWELYNERLSFV